MSTPKAGFIGRVLPPKEWERVEHVLSLSQEPRPDPKLAKIQVVEKDGEVVACFSSQLAVYLSHLWVREDCRGGYLAEMLARKTIELYPEGMRAFMTATNPHAEVLAFRVGMYAQKGQIWQWLGYPIKDGD